MFNLKSFTMKKVYLLLFSLFISIASFAQTAGVDVFINEIHYDNAGTDVGEFVEIAGPAGTDLTNWSLILYNGGGGASYDTVALSGVIPNEGGTGFGAISTSFPSNGIQNGAPDGVALVDPSNNVQFLSYEGTFTAVGGPADGITSTDIGVVEPGAIGESLQLIGTGSVATDFTWTGPVAESPGTINSGQTFSLSSTPTITITSPAEGSTLPPLSSPVNISLNVNNFTVASPSAGDGFIKYTVDGGSAVDKFDTANIALSLSAGAHTVTVELVDNSGASLSPAATDVVNFTIATLTPIADIETLRLQTPGPNNFYQLTGEAVVTFAVALRNQKYIQDATAGILVDDASGTITTTYTQGDGVTGLKGTLSSFNGVMQFVPIEDPGSPSSLGNQITPQTVSLSDFNLNFDSFESRIVKVTGVTISEVGGATTFVTPATPGATVGATNYNVTDGIDITTLRTQHFESNLNGVTIPLTPVDLIVIAAEFNGTPQFFPFYDFVNNPPPALLSVDDFTLTQNALRIYPNPVSGGVVNIVSANNFDKEVEVFDLLGKRVLQANGIRSEMNVSGLRSGVYLLKITEDGQTQTRKLVVSN